MEAMKKEERRLKKQFRYFSFADEGYVRRLKRRKVVGVEYRGNNLCTYDLELECGHETTMHDKGKKRAPYQTACWECELLLDRVRNMQGWFLAKDAKATHQQLQTLQERDNLVESRKAHGISTVYWRYRKEMEEGEE